MVVPARRGGEAAGTSPRAARAWNGRRFVAVGAREIAAAHGMTCAMMGCPWRPALGNHPNSRMRRAGRPDSPRCGLSATSSKCSYYSIIPAISSVNPGRRRHSVGSAEAGIMRNKSTWRMSHSSSILENLEPPAPAHREIRMIARAGHASMAHVIHAPLQSLVRLLQRIRRPFQARAARGCPAASPPRRVGTPSSPSAAASRWLHPDLDAILRAFAATA